ncbi:type II toxin-antitoxin system Phd/YefM family antitoxin [Bdellovibrionota bacterium FG-2]
MGLKAIQLSTDLVTVAEFKDHAGAYLDRVQSSGHPIVITKNGKAAGVIVSPEEYDRIYSERFMASVAKGVADGDAGRVVSTEELERQLAKRRKTRK